MSSENWLVDRMVLDYLAVALRRQENVDSLMLDELCYLQDCALEMGIDYEDYMALRDETDKRLIKPFIFIRYTPTLAVEDGETLSQLSKSHGADCAVW